MLDNNEQIPPHWFTGNAHAGSGKCEAQFDGSRGNTWVCGKNFDDPIHAMSSAPAPHEFLPGGANPTLCDWRWVPFGGIVPMVCGKWSGYYQHLRPVPELEPTLEDLRDRYPEVERFAELMLRELWANRGKGDQAGWRKDSARELWNEVQWHSAKLAVALKAHDKSREPSDADDVREYAADTANMAMMLLDTLGLLPSGENDGK